MSQVPYRLRYAARRVNITIGCSRLLPFKVNGYTFIILCAIFTEENKFHGFLFAFLDNKAFPKLGLPLKERICSSGSKFFPLKS